MWCKGLIYSHLQLLPHVLLGILLITDVFCDLVLMTVRVGGEIHTGVRDCFLRACVVVFITILKFLRMKKFVLFSCVISDEKNIDVCKQFTEIRRILSHHFLEL